MSAQQTVIIDANGVFAPTENVAILANKIIFGSTLTEAQGIFIANSATVNSYSTPTSDVGLKIGGNLILQTKVINNRTRLDNSRPALFVVANPGAYLALLPYLSTTVYDWKQTR